MMNHPCGSCGYTVDPDCEYCKGTGEVESTEPKPRLTKTVWCERCKKNHEIDITPLPDDHQVFDTMPELRDAAPGTQRLYADVLANTLQEIMEREDEEWAKRVLNLSSRDPVSSLVRVTERDNSVRLSAVDGTVLQEGESFILDLKKPGKTHTINATYTVHTHDDVANLKAEEAKRYALVRNRSGNAPPVNKTKMRNRKKAKAARAARKGKK